jgi:BolA protein
MHENRKSRLESTLKEHFAPIFLDVINESSMHRVPKNAETHFKIIIVSNTFLLDKKIQRHKKIYQLLIHELNTGLHALSLHTYTVEEWQNQNNLPSSPRCAHVDKTS